MKEGGSNAAAAGCMLLLLLVVVGWFAAIGFIWSLIQVVKVFTAP